MFDWLIFVAVVIAAAIIVQLLMDRQYVNVHGRYILITGCDTGFGSMLAHILSDKRGINVIAACFTKEGMRQFQENGEGTTKKVTPIQMDVTSTKSIQNSLKEVKKIIPQGMGLWGLVNNAGINEPIGHYCWLKRKEISHILEVNLVGTIEVTSVFFPLLRTARGRVVNMSSMVGLFPSLSTVYALTKAGVEAYSDNIRVVMSSFKVSVHLVEPAAFKTGLTDPQNVLDSLQMVWDRLPEEEKQAAGGEALHHVRQGSLRDTLSKASPKLHQVTDSIEHALCARWPWRRYLPGLQAKFFCKPMSMLPACIADPIVVWLNSARN